MSSRHSEYDRANRKARQAGWRESKARYSDRRKQERAEEREKKFRELEFCVWDGEGSEVPEGTPQPYMLFGNTDGLSIQAEQLTTEQCLDLICQGDPKKVNVSFAFTYDVNQIIWQIPYRRVWSLMRGRTIIYHGFILQWAPGKWLQVRRNRKGERGIKIHDGFHFFNSSLVAAINKYKIGTEDERRWLEQKKAERSQFRWEDIEEVKRYFQLEGRLMVELYTYIRDVFADAGMFISSWHGPGAVARYMLRTHNVKVVDTRKTNPEVWIAARYAFSAGRFEQFLAGFYDGRIWNYDIHSAFPYAIQFLPDLSKGFWRHNLRVDRDRIDPMRFSVYLIKYDNPDQNSWKPHPLFRRLPNDNICWPNKVNGWYWSPEADLVKDDPNAEFIEEWEFVGDGSRPMAWIADIYDTREYHKRLGHVIEYPFKLGMNSCYGQFAQRSGWQNVRLPDGTRGGPPPYHQLEWAGYITSMCKSMVYKVAQWAYEHNGLITIDTDGIFSTVPVPESVLPNGIGNKLGQWEEAVYEGILIYQNGFYWLKKDGEWSKAKSRGAPRGTVPIEKAWEAMAVMEAGGKARDNRIHYSKTIYTSFGKARALGNLASWRSWQTLPHELVFGGTGKRQHSTKTCPTCLATRDPRILEQMIIQCETMSHSMHILKPMPFGHWTRYRKGIADDHWSVMHRLPWINPPEDTAAEELTDLEIEEIPEEYLIYRDEDL